MAADLPRDHVRRDEFDRRIRHSLMGHARTTGASQIAADVNIPPATIRNRIGRLEDRRIVTRPFPTVDVEQAKEHLRTRFLRNVPVPEIDRITAHAGAIPGMLNVGGRINQHVPAVGPDTDKLRRTGRQLMALGLGIADELLVQEGASDPYGPFGPAAEPEVGLADAVALAGGTEIFAVTGDADAPIVGRTIESAVDVGFLEDDALLMAIERGGETNTPHGDTEIRPDDIVTALLPSNRDALLNGSETVDAHEVDHT